MQGPATTLNIRWAAFATSKDSLGAYLIVFLFVAASGAMIALCGFSLEARTSGKILAGIALLIGSGMLLNGLGHSRIGSAVEATAMFLIVSITGMFVSVVLASTNLPYADDSLIRWDASLGFHWLPVYDFFRSRSDWFEWTASIYATLRWQPFLAIFILCFLNDERKCWLFIKAWVTSLALTLAIFPFFPAIAAATYYKAGPVIKGPTPLTWLEVLHVSRSGSLRVLDDRSFVGLITFPSFHAAAAVLLAWAFIDVRYLRWPFLALNMAMALSAIIIGGHYLVDILSGVIIAVLSIFLCSKEYS